MDRKGFDSKWRFWIHGCLESSHFSILINGSPKAFSPPLVVLDNETLFSFSFSPYGRCFQSDFNKRRGTKPFQRFSGWKTAHPSFAFTICGWHHFFWMAIPFKKPYFPYPLFWTRLRDANKLAKKLFCGINSPSQDFLRLSKPYNAPLAPFRLITLSSFRMALERGIFGFQLLKDVIRN